MKQIRQLTTATAIWIGLVLALLFYLATILGPFFVLGIYKMSRPELFANPTIEAGGEATRTDCVISLLFIFPFLIAALLNLYVTWHNTSRRSRAWKSLIVSAAVLILVISYLYGVTLYYWAVDSWGYPKD
jgi:hypothetical protein